MMPCIFRSVPGCDLAAALIFEGAFEDVVAPIQSLLRWIGLHKHVPAGPLRELHLSGPAHENDGAGQHQCNRATGSRSEPIPSR